MLEYKTNFKLLPHQEVIVTENKPKILCDMECRTGKTLPACHWIDNPSQTGNTFIICKKSNKKEWQNMGTMATVLTKEEFKKVAHTIKNPTAIVVDEVHRFGASLFVKPRSDLATALYNLLREYPSCHFMGLSGSMVRNSPWSFHTLMCYIGVYYDWKKYREEMFELKEARFVKRPIWMSANEVPKAWLKKKDWRARVDVYRKKYCHQVSLSEVVDNLPPITDRIIKIKQPEYIEPEDEIVTWTHEHLHEQKNKWKEIIDLEYKKIIVVAYYTEQILELEIELSEYKPVFILNGQTKDQEAVIKQAQEAEECYFIIQTSMAEGIDGWMFSCMVFVSMSHVYTDYVQMISRQRHPKHLRDIEIIYIQGGRWDKRIYDSIMLGENFNPHSFK